MHHPLIIRIYESFKASEYYLIIQPITKKLILTINKTSQLRELNANCNGILDAVWERNNNATWFTDDSKKDQSSTISEYQSIWGMVKVYVEYIIQGRIGSKIISITLPPNVSLYKVRAFRNWIIT